MQAYLLVFFQSIVERRGFPGVCKEDYANSLAKIIELKTCSSDRGHNRSIVDTLYRDVEFSSPEDEVGMGGGSVWSLIRIAVYFSGIAAGSLYPKGSPTTKKATSEVSALDSISSLADSTISRSAKIIGRP